MQSTPQRVEEQLVGVWIPTMNRTQPDRLFPRLVFVGDQGHFEDGDYPAIYSVEHFSYCLAHATVLEITESSQEYLNDDRDGTAHDESWIVPGFYDLAFHTFSTGLFLDIDFLNPAWPGFSQFFKTEESVGADYSPRWTILE